MSMSSVEPIGYVRDAPGAVTVPPYEGDRYAAVVPDTLDLQERAGLAVNALTGPTDPDADYEIYWAVSFRHRPATHAARLERSGPVQVHGCTSTYAHSEREHAPSRGGTTMDGGVTASSGARRARLRAAAREAMGKALVGI